MDKKWESFTSVCPIIFTTILVHFWSFRLWLLNNNFQNIFLLIYSEKWVRRFSKFSMHPELKVSFFWSFVFNLVAKWGVRIGDKQVLNSDRSWKVVTNIQFICRNFYFIAFITLWKHREIAFDHLQHVMYIIASMIDIQDLVSYNLNTRIQQQILSSSFCSNKTHKIIQLKNWLLNFSKKIDIIKIFVGSIHLRWPILLI